MSALRVTATLVSLMSKLMCRPSILLPPLDRTDFSVHVSCCFFDKKIIIIIIWFLIPIKCSIEQQGTIGDWAVMVE